jgi:hypothetical protein
LLGGFLSSMKGSSFTFVGSVVRAIFQVLDRVSLSMDGCLLPQCFVGDGITGNAFKSDYFLATGNDGMPGVFLGSDKLMVVKVVL